MATITLQGNPINTNGDLPAVGATAPDFTLTNGELAEVSLSDFDGKKKVLNIFPSIDTGICALSTKAFNEAAKSHPDTMFLTVSADLPFALGRFCGAEGLETVQPLSMMKNRQFAEDYGVSIVDGPLASLAARAVVILNEKNEIIYTELVPEIAQEPDYNSAIAAL
ncbi:thiol peroxidase [Leucothrix pacifica]|uniref:Thiol peroxidase n=1 Tax=Leucothrix pacifica TaxID=1247513 RepID=A0A317CQQ7_9GAMM|nr:thiol peroxidase [Leucothrix pacifica]PWQ98622.1 thiol peroxidase [Leucothrix pacifica]